MTAGSGRFAVYGDVDLNLIDGSAIWLASVVEVLAADLATQVTVVCKVPIERDLVVAPLLALPNVELVAHPEITRRLRPTEALDLIEDLDRVDRFDAVLLRGYALCREAATREQLRSRLWVYLTDVPQSRAAVTDEDREALGAIADASHRLLCQTEELRTHLEAVVPGATWRTALLPPMVPSIFDQAPRPLQDPPKLFYAGKFAPLWGFLETVEQFRELRRRFPGLELHVAGDKIHDPRDAPDFAPAVRAALTETAGLVWHGAVSRQEVARILGRMDLAFSARHPRMDASLELSTKVLEYGAASVPPVINRNPMHVRLFGEDYPLFVESPADIGAVVGAALDDPARWQLARDRAHAVSGRAAFEAVREQLEPVLADAVPTPRLERPILVASHDLKFLESTLAGLRRRGATITIDHWGGHAQHDEERSIELLATAEVIVCEWGLGNAVWYAEHVGSDQRLIVRVHGQELRTDFPERLDLDRVHRIVVVSPLMAERCVAELGWPRELIEVIPNGVQVRALDRPKLPESRFRLGLLGMVPRLKRLDRAVELVERLRRVDERFHLRIAGPLPWEIPWAWARLEERSYYTDLFDAIRRDPGLYRAVRFDGRVHHVPEWLREVGWVLSPSDFESFHLAPVEGMASGALPLVFDREGAADIFPAEWIVPDVDAAVALVLDHLDRFEERSAAVRREACERYDLDRLTARWVALLAGRT